MASLVLDTLTRKPKNQLSAFAYDQSYQIVK